jgi:dihydrofolate reductase
MKATSTKDNKIIIAGWSIVGRSNAPNQGAEACRGEVRTAVRNRWLGSVARQTIRLAMKSRTRGERVPFPPTAVLPYDSTFAMEPTLDAAPARAFPVLPAATATKRHLPLKDEGSLIVLTHDASMRSPRANVIFTDQQPREIVSLLEARGHSEAVIIGGTATVDAFMKTGLVDEVLRVVEPVLFGKGLPLLTEDLERRLTLVDVARVNQMVWLHYSCSSS